MKTSLHSGPQVQLNLELGLAVPEPLRAVRRRHAEVRFPTAEPRVYQLAELRDLPKHKLLHHELAHPDQVTRYREEKQQFERALESQPKRLREAYKDSIATFLLIDWGHLAPHALDVFNNRGKRRLPALDLPSLYDEALLGGDLATPFENLKRAKRYLQTTDEPPGVDRLLKVHAMMMHGGVEGVTEKALGKIRNYGAEGVETKPGITADQLSEIYRHPLLGFEEVGRKTDKFYTPRICGTIQYPDALNIQDRILNELRAIDPELANSISAFQKRVTNGRAHPYGPEFKVLTQNLLLRLLEAEYRDFTSARERLIGRLDDPEAILSYIKLVALHYRKIVAIHPFNGTGRTARMEALFAPLEEVGISRPRLHELHNDLLVSERDWVDQVHRGIQATAELYRDLTDRAVRGYCLEGSPELLFPWPKREVGVTIIEYRKQRSDLSYGLRDIDLHQFATYYASRLSAPIYGPRADQLERQVPALCYPKIVTSFESSPVTVAEQLREEFTTFSRATRFRYKTQDGYEDIGAELIDHDFIDRFGRVQAGNREEWVEKIDRWYYPTMLWRGVPGFGGRLRESLLIENFSTLTGYTISNRISNWWERYPRAGEKALLRQAKEDFRRFNAELIGGAYVDTAFAHTHVEPESAYYSSYGLSTSADWKTARRFAFGAMQDDAGTTNFNQLLKLQADLEITSRVVIGSYRARKDLDINRLGVIDNRFNSRSSRQSEILAIGGLDPDSVMVVTLYDARGTVTRSYIRNVEKPSELWVTKPGYDPAIEGLAEPPTNQVQKTVNLPRQ